MATKVVPTLGMALVISPYDEWTVEVALRIRDKVREGKITIISLGPESAREVIKRSLAMGTDKGMLLSDPALQSTGAKRCGNICGSIEGDRLWFCRW